MARARPLYRAFVALVACAMLVVASTGQPRAHGDREPSHLDAVVVAKIAPTRRIASTSRHVTPDLIALAAVAPTTITPARSATSTGPPTLSVARRSPPWCTCSSRGPPHAASSGTPAARSSPS